MKRIVYVYFFSALLLLTKFSFGFNYSETSIEHNAKAYNLKICIPENYNPGQMYPLIVGLHYCGGNAQMYRDALSSLADSLNVIIACPDNNSSEITPSLSSLITISIDTIKTLFSIDEDEVFLTGMSCNGKATLLFGSDDTYNFKGIFPWAPYIFSSDLLRLNTKSDMPTTLAIGTKDASLKTVLSLYDSLKTVNNNVNLILVKDVGHTLNFNDFPDEMIRCYRYINDNDSITISAIDDVDIADNESKEIELSIENNTQNELSYRILSSHPKSFNAPDFSVIETEKGSTLNLSLKPILGEAGIYYVVIEVSAKTGNAIEQRVIKVNVNSTVSNKTKLRNDNMPQVFPNPFYEKLYVNNITGLSEIRIVDAYGKIVYKANTNTISSPINSTSLPSGLYNLTIIKDGIVSNQKIIKTK